MVFGLRRSRILDAGLLIVVILAGAATLGFQCSPSIQTGLLVVNIIVAAWAWLALRPAIKEIKLERSGEIFFSRVGESAFLKATFKPRATIHPLLCIIRLKAEDGRAATIIATVDNLNRDDFRRLRMFMRWQANFSEPSDDV